MRWIQHLLFLQSSKDRQGQILSVQPRYFQNSFPSYRIREKWEKYLGERVYVRTEQYLQTKYNITNGEDCIVIPSVLLPDYNLAKEIKSLKSGRLVKDGFVLATVGTSMSSSADVEYKGKVYMLKSLTDIFSYNGMEIVRDFELITSGRLTEKISSTNVVFGKYPLFVEKGCTVECATLNTNDGPIYIGANSEVMEGANIRGPFAMCEHAVLKMGAKMYGDTTVGPWCKVGGELSNVVFFGYSNKAHDGFLGNSVVGEWCNFGADSNNSNLKNNYADMPNGYQGYCCRCFCKYLWRRISKQVCAVVFLGRSFRIYRIQVGNGFRGNGKGDGSPSCRIYRYRQGNNETYFRIKS